MELTYPIGATGTWATAVFTSLISLLTSRTFRRASLLASSMFRKLSSIKEI